MTGGLESRNQDMTYVEGRQEKRTEADTHPHTKERGLQEKSNPQCFCFLGCPAICCVDRGQWTWYSLTYRQSRAAQCMCRQRNLLSFSLGSQPFASSRRFNKLLIKNIQEQFLVFRGISMLFPQHYQQQHIRVSFLPQSYQHL